MRIIGLRGYDSPNFLREDHLSANRTSEGASTVQASIHLPIERERAFDVFVDQLSVALSLAGMEFMAGPTACVKEREFEVARVAAWKPGQQILLQWRAVDWVTGPSAEVELRLEESNGCTKVTVEHRGWGKYVGDANEMLGWFSGEVAGPMLAAMAPAGLGDWITDRRARRPGGAASRGIYADPLFHYPNFRVILAGAR